jgi:hypothetical protein
VNQGNEFADEVKSVCADEVKSVSRFIDALPSCLLMDLGFHIQSKTSGESKCRICVQHDICITFLILTTYDTFRSTILTADIDKKCICPCSKQNKKWRDNCGIKIDKDLICKKLQLAPSPLMDHIS